MMKALIFAVITSVLSAIPAQASYRDTSAPIKAVDTIDWDQYLGKWYEYARFPNRFEDNCFGVTAEYSKNSDGSIKVLNTCRIGNLDGPKEQVKGRATIEDIGKLGVNFVRWLPFIKGDYWILWVDDAYSYAVVGTPSGKTGWVLSRAPVLEPNKWQKALNVLEGAGYETDALEIIAH